MKMPLSVRYKTFDQYFSVNIPIAKALNSPMKERERKPLNVEMLKVA